MTFSDDKTKILLFFQNVLKFESRMKISHHFFKLLKNFECWKPLKKLDENENFVLYKYNCGFMHFIQPIEASYVIKTDNFYEKVQIFKSFKKLVNGLKWLRMTFLYKPTWVYITKKITYKICVFFKFFKIF